MTQIVSYRIWDSTFEDILTNDRGSGLSLSREDKNLSLIRTNFLKCVTTSESGGGGFYARVKAVEEICCYFDGCRAPDNGCAFLIDSTCLNTTILFTSITNQDSFVNDGFYRFGKLKDLMQDSNSTKLFGKGLVCTCYPLAQTTVIYRFVNLINDNAQDSGLFYSSSKLTIESSNIINCKAPNFINFFAPEGSLFSLINSIISNCTYTSFYIYNAPSLNIHSNTYSSSSLMALFKPNSGQVTANPETLLFTLPRCSFDTYIDFSPGKSSKALAILLTVNISCC